jgi:hypothetical protein
VIRQPDKAPWHLPLPNTKRRTRDGERGTVNPEHGPPAPLLFAMQDAVTDIEKARGVSPTSRKLPRAGKRPQPEKNYADS